MSGDPRRQDPEDWEEVHRRKGRKNDRQGEGNNKVISKFFVSNLPQKCSSQDLKVVLGGFGRYEGAYIARKLDKWGKRFAFVSFAEVNDSGRMVEAISDVWIGSYKLFITVARFVDGMKVQQPAATDHVRKEKAVNIQDHANSNIENHEGRGVNSSVKGLHDSATGNGRSFLYSVLNRNKVDVIRVDDVVERFSHYKGIGLVGRVVAFNILCTLNVLIHKFGCYSVDLKYLGGFTVALVFKDSGMADKFLTDDSNWSAWFETLFRWDGKVVKVEERIAWLKVHGVPAQLALDQVFDLIGCRYGKVIKAACLSNDDHNFSYALIGVMSKVRKQIVDWVDIAWRELTFNVWVDEDVGEWIPDGVTKLDEDDVSTCQEEDKLEDNIQQDTNMDATCEEGEFVVNEVNGEDGNNSCGSHEDGIDHGVADTSAVQPEPMTRMTVT
ncbi:putative RNA recognition motif domain, nucleotide-binding alpha-beta plait domain superfamily [Helianthus annuus]|nr:putative RNA recognition motif domain, nucleotide-binding alpha-beta plait domain superfamily [Helianthus annuus]